MPADAEQTTTATSNLVRELAEPLGFAMVAVAPAEPTAHRGYLRDWLARGEHGEMSYLADHFEQRTDPRVLLPGAKAVICVADWYGKEGPGAEGEGPRAEGQGRRTEDLTASDMAHRTSPIAHDPPLGRIARYAWGDDYHKVMKKRLFTLADALRERWPDEQFRVAVDTAPVLEREHAARAGMGWIGKHTLLIHPRVGSWFLLGEIVTTLGVEREWEGEAPAEPAAIEDRGPGRPSAPAAPASSAAARQEPRPPARTAVPLGDHCGTCTRCIDACPTDCIRPYQLDASRCISYLTIEHRSLIDPDLHEPMGDWIAGCDICQDVCPFNRRGDEGSAAPLPPRHPRYAPRPPAPAIGLLEVLNWSADDRQAAFRGSALKRIKLDMLKRNALIAAGNALAQQDDEKLLYRIRELADDDSEPPLVRDTARQVLARLTDAGQPD